MVDACIMYSLIKISDEGVVEEEIEMAQCHRHPAAYTNLTDHVFQLILTSAEPAEVCIDVLITPVNQWGINI